MAQMGKYCKAYLVSKLREYGNWKEVKENACPDEGSNGEESLNKPRELTDDSILYVQENFIVTDGIFMDGNIIFDDVNDEWKNFCKNELEFCIPEYVLQMASDEDAIGSNEIVVETEKSESVAGET